MQTKSTTYLSNKEFEFIVLGAYGIQYDVAMDNEMDNDTNVVFNAKKGMSEWEKNEIARWRSSGGEKGTYMLHCIVADLCEHGILPEGDYVLTVSWWKNDE